MTAPLATEQTDGQQHDTRDELAAIALLATWFGSRDAVAATLLPERYVAMLVALGLERRAVVAAGRLAMAHPLTGRGRGGSPTVDSAPTTTLVRSVAAQEPEMRARYVLNAARRLTKALLAGGSALFPAAIRIESTFMDQQRAAGMKRRKAVAELDRVSALAGPNGKWRWNAAHDDRVTPDCAALDGTLHNAGESADGKIPGAVHLQCRCFPTVASDVFAPQPQIFGTPWHAA